MVFRHDRKRLTNVSRYCAVLQHVYQDTNNRVGKGFAILGIYIFVVCYCKRSNPTISAVMHSDAVEQMP